LSEILIRSSQKAYGIYFQPLNLNDFENTYFLADERFQERFNQQEGKIVFLKADETKKNLTTVEDVMMQLSEKGMTKNNELLVIGGGYLQDVGTLVASLYMRGVNWTYAPTTLAAMGDSCIGGKSSINAGRVKNLVGNFYPPDKVLIDSTFVTTLPNLEIIAGISEIIKICFAKSFEDFNLCSELIDDWTVDSKSNSVSEIVKLSLRSKKYFVEEDEFDSGIRKQLNFGHSFGHALESASEYKIPHGVAVLLGMIAACKHPKSYQGQETNTLIGKSLAFSGAIRGLIESEISNIDFEKFAKALKKDKKNTDTCLVLILPSKSGLAITKIPFNENAVEDATDAMKSGIEMVLNEIR
jgi:3-dehydroquinate synthase